MAAARVAAIGRGDGGHHEFRKNENHDGRLEITNGGAGVGLGENRMKNGVAFARYAFV